jgi:FkbM family methyltransferase
MISFIKHLIPKSFFLPMQYTYYKLRGRLEEEIFLVKDFVDKEKISLDIGANFGLFSLVLGKLCSHVEAFEPLPLPAGYLSAYAKRKKNITVHQIGLSDADGELMLNVPCDKKGNLLTGYASFTPIDPPSKQFPVPVKKLDDFQFTNVGFIKIDVEGFEREVLKGAEKTIMREKPVILIEIEERHLNKRDMSVNNTFQIFQKMNYSGQFYHQGKFFPISDFSVSRHQQEGVCYINNFFFLPNDK